MFFLPSIKLVSTDITPTLNAWGITSVTDNDKDGPFLREPLASLRWQWPILLGVAVGVASALLAKQLLS